MAAMTSFCAGKWYRLATENTKRLPAPYSSWSVFITFVFSR